MKIPGAADIRNWDQYTIAHEPISPIDLMERAATSCIKWLDHIGIKTSSFHIFCGKGNNGGDGLAIARMLAGKGIKVAVHILEFGHLGTADFQANLARLHQFPEAEIKFIQSEENFPSLEKDSVIIDALFGSGLNRKLESVTANLVDHLNAQDNLRISIDIPSGMSTDHSSFGNPMIRADHTLAFQCYKPAFMFAENGPYTGEVHILDIGLHPAFYDSIYSSFELVDEEIVAGIFRPRKSYTHKGDHGHALIMAGGYGKAGAAVLCARACLRSGVGLLSCQVPKSGYEIMQSAVPESMLLTDVNSSFITGVEEDLTKYEAIGIGPGIGKAPETRKLLKEVFGKYRKPMVIDADALNILGMEKELLANVPAGSILTPHPKEFERVFGETRNDFEKIELAKQMANKMNVVIVLKGQHTAIASPGEKIFFNSTGNAGMATGGSGDVLTGILTALLAQGYPSMEASMLGVYLHGMAGDLAKKDLSMEGMIAGDIVEYLPKAFLYVNTL